MKRPSTLNNFGARLTSIRRSRGLTQNQLGKMVGVSHRVIAYYEGETQHPPAHLIVPLAKALKISADELLGIKEIKNQIDSEHAALLRKLKKISMLSTRDRKSLYHYLNLLLKKNEAKFKNDAG